MITERSPDVSPFSAIESIANWLSGTFISQPLRSRIEWRLCEGQSGALTVRKWPIPLKNWMVSTPCLAWGLMKELVGVDDFSWLATFSAFLRFSFRLCGSKRWSWGRWT